MNIKFIKINGYGLKAFFQKSKNSDVENHVI